MISNSQLRSEARISLGNGKWGIAIGGFLIYFIITQAIGLIPIIGPIGNILLGGPFAVGLMYFYLKISKKTVEKEFISMASMNCWIYESDVGKMCGFLISDDAARISGQIIGVDGDAIRLH